MGTRKEVPADQCRDGVAGQAEHRGVSQAPGHQRLSGAHGDLVERAVEAEAFGDGPHEVMVADRGAADGHDEVGIARQAENGGEAFGIVPRDGQEARDPALRLDQRLQPVGVGGGDLVGAAGRRRAGQARRPWRSGPPRAAG
jgi:hypothetical protein